jgi:hypothetical protein
VTDLVTQPDVEAALLRPLTAAEENYLPLLVEQATAQLVAAVPNVQDRINAWGGTHAAPALDPALVASLLARVIARFLRNPDGASSINQTIGPYASSRSYAGNSGLAGITVTEADLALLAGPTSYVPPRTIKTRPRGLWCS